jgi:mevalonate kinase
MEKKRYYKKKGGEVHMGQEWDSDESSTYSSSDEDAAIITVNKGLLFPNGDHKCLMAKDDKKKKVHSRDTPKYTTSDDEGSSSDNEDDLTSLFANLTKDQKKKINELIESINEKDDLLKCQEDLLVKENKKFVKLKYAYPLEVKKCENLSKELNMCNDSISRLRIENDNLIAMIEELNVCKPSTSTV